MPSVHKSVRSWQELRKGRSLESQRICRKAASSSTHYLYADDEDILHIGSLRDKLKIRCASDAPGSPVSPIVP